MSLKNNKVVLSDGTTLMDITDTTATEVDVSTGKYFYKADGSLVEGTYNVDWTISNCAYLFYQGHRAVEAYTEIMARVKNPTSLYNIFGTWYSGSGNLQPLPGAPTNIVIPHEWDLSYINDANGFFGVFNNNYTVETVDFTNFSLIVPNSNISSMFYNCRNLQKVLIGNENTSYQNVNNSQYLFYYCERLDDIVINGVNVLRLTASNALLNLKSTCKIYVPDTLVYTYRTASNWSTRASYIFPLSEYGG